MSEHHQHFFIERKCYKHKCNLDWALLNKSNQSTTNHRIFFMIWFISINSWFRIYIWLFIIHFYTIWQRLCRHKIQLRYQFLHYITCLMPKLFQIEMPALFWICSISDWNLVQNNYKWEFLMPTPGSLVGLWRFNSGLCSHGHTLTTHYEHIFSCFIQN